MRQCLCRKRPSLSAQRWRFTAAVCSVFWPPEGDIQQQTKRPPSVSLYASSLCPHTWPDSCSETGARQFDQCAAGSVVIESTAHQFFFFLNTSSDWLHFMKFIVGGELMLQALALGLFWELFLATRGIRIEDSFFAGRFLFIYSICFCQKLFC